MSPFATMRYCSVQRTHDQRQPRLGLGQGVRGVSADLNAAAYASGRGLTLPVVGARARQPGVFGIFAGFADDAKVENGYLKLPDRPGIGFETQNALYAVMRDIATAA